LTGQKSADTMKKRSDAMITVRQIMDAKDANIRNEPFSIWGKMLPSLQEGKWNYETVLFPEVTEMCFPDFPYDPQKDDAYFIGAYDGDVCVGVAVLRRQMFKYLYLEDLKVNKNYRRQGIGSMLTEACMEKAREEKMRGVYVIAQDNNLSACNFYVKCGFEIGGFDNRCYRGTAQEEKADIYFYRDI
jgi:ribosomal protein S18 acetylase RimI-like enzyme